ncbi:MAG TPA: hypothetical protein VHK69_17450, partial [Chitinophagaceae bacterium]|nr:hypothetical protein [Chitinophagaceae bacterium]
VKEKYLKDLGLEPSEKSYIYDAEGNILRINVDFISDHYAYRYERSGAGDPWVKVYLEGLPNPHGRYQLLRFDRDNRVENSTVSGKEYYGYTYTFDAGINPYVHTGWPDILYGRLSKNNVRVERFHRDGVASQLIRFEYQYDGDGYITQVIRKEGDPREPDFTIVSKKEFKYQ